MKINVSGNLWDHLGQKIPEERQPELYFVPVQSNVIGNALVAGYEAKATVSPDGTFTAELEADPDTEFRIEARWLANPDETDPDLQARQYAEWPSTYKLFPGGDISALIPPNSQIEQELLDMGVMLSSRGQITAPTDIDAMRTRSDAGTYAGRIQNLLGGPPLPHDTPCVLTIDWGATNGVVQRIETVATSWVRSASGTETWGTWREQPDVDDVMPRHAGLITTPTDLDALRTIDDVGNYAGRIQNMVGGPSWIPYDTGCTLSIDWGASNGVVQQIASASAGIAVRHALGNNGWGPWYRIDNDSSGATDMPFTKIVGWGDSMTTDYATAGTSQISLIAGELGVDFENQGISGDATLEIAWRMGALRWEVEVDGGVIPATGSVAVTVNPGTGYFNSKNWAAVVCDIDGNEVPVTLSHPFVSMGGTPAWTIEQRAGTEPVTILPGSRIWRDNDATMNALPATIWMGRNDSAQDDLSADRLEQALRAALSQHRDPKRRRLVFPPFNRSTEPSGTPEYARVMAIGARAAEVAGDDFYDLRSALIRSGLDIVGITPTEADTTAISEDRIPESLMADITHLNVDGKTAVARLVANEIRGRRW